MGHIIKISPLAIIGLSKVKLHPSVEIGEFSIIGKKIPDLKGKKETKINAEVSISSNVIIYEGTEIGSKTQIEDFCRIGEKTRIGENCRIIYGAKIYGYVTIGNKCIIGGFICEDVTIGNSCRIFGELVHDHKIKPEKFHDIKKWDKGGEKAPVIQDNVFIGFGAKVIGNISIGKGSYILPNSIVTQDVPKNSIVKGINKISPINCLFRETEKKVTKK